MNMDPRMMGRLAVQTRAVETKSARYNEKPVAPHMRKAWDVIRGRYDTRMAAAEALKVCSPYLSQILRGVKPMPGWMREELGL